MATALAAPPDDEWNEPDGSQPLQNARHERFVQLVAKDSQSNGACYMECYPDTSTEAAQSSASDILRNPMNLARLRHLRARSRANVLSLLRKQELLSDMGEGRIPSKRVVKETPDGTFTEKHFDQATCVMHLAKLMGELDRQPDDTGLNVLVQANVQVNIEKNEP